MQQMTQILRPAVQFPQTILVQQAPKIRTVASHVRPTQSTQYIATIIVAIAACAIVLSIYTALYYAFKPRSITPTVSQLEDWTITMKTQVMKMEKIWTFTHANMDELRQVLPALINNGIITENNIPWQLVGPIKLEPAPGKNPQGIPTELQSLATIL